MVLNRRILRELKANFSRYFSLLVLVAFGMFACTAMSASADSVITTVEDFWENSNIEDGRFSVLVPLSDSELDSLRSSGVGIEPQFSMDLTLSDDSVLRIYKKRSSIDVEHVDKGSSPQASEEIMLERSFADAHSLGVGDTIDIAGQSMKITGLGVSPDYDFLLENFTDTAANAKHFGIAFVSEEGYDMLSRLSDANSEEYLYTYTLPDGMTSAQIKKMVDDFDFDHDDVENPYIRELLDRVYDTRDSCTDGVDKLSDAVNELDDGIKELDSSGSDLREAAENMRDLALQQASQQVTAAGGAELTLENYAEVLDQLSALSPQFTVLKEQIDGYCKFADSVSEYVDGVGKASDGSGEIAEKVSDFKGDLLDFIDEAANIDFNNISSFIQKDANPRIGASLAKVGMYHIGGYIAGVIMLVLFGYICSVFVISNIENESQFIGALYSMGVHRRKILAHYVTLPVVISFIGGIIGTMAGYSPLGRGMLTDSVIGPYSVPEVVDHYSVGLLLYGIFMPPILAAVVNWFCLRRKLNTEPLKLLRKEQKQSHLLNVDLKNAGFVKRFRIRQILRELRITAAMFFAIVTGMLLLMLAVMTYVCIDDLSAKYEKDIPYKYCYYLKYPDLENVPDNAEACYAKNLSYTYLNYTLQVTVMGIENNSEHFPFEVSHDRNYVTVAEGTAIKYDLKEGDMLCLSDDSTGITYAFTVDSIVPYSAGLNVFMDIETARELFDEDDDYYNMLLSDSELDVDAGRVLSVTDKESMINAIDTLLSDMMPMILMTGISALVVYIAVLYIMMKVMIDRSAFQISLIRIFGYNLREIKRLYLDGNLLTVIVSTLLALPVSKTIMDLIWPLMVYNQPAGYASTLKIWHYAAIALITFLCYFVTNTVLIGRIRRITPAEVLKDRQ